MLVPFLSVVSYAAHLQSLDEHGSSLLNCDKFRYRIASLVGEISCRMSMVNGHGGWLCWKLVWVFYWAIPCGWYLFDWDIGWYSSAERY